MWPIYSPHTESVYSKRIAVFGTDSAEMQEKASDNRDFQRKGNNT